jgi:hypothetical protein
VSHLRFKLRTWRWATKVQTTVLLVRIWSLREDTFYIVARWLFNLRKLNTNWAEIVLYLLSKTGCTGEVHDGRMSTRTPETE